MTFGQYYIAQFKEIPNVWKIAKRFNKKWAFLGTVSLLLVPTYIYMMYLYDTGKMQVDTRYMKQKPIKKYCGRCKKEIKQNDVKDFINRVQETEIEIKVKSGKIEKPFVQFRYH